MVENTKKIKGFSLTETIVLLVVLSIAVAASTPMLSRKIANNADSGTTLSGFGSHGRYEIYAKEVVSFPNGGGFTHLEKTTENKKTLGGGNDIIVFRRLDDWEFKEVVNRAAGLHDNGKYKETLYEQINDAKVFRDSNGEIKSVEFKDLNDKDSNGKPKVKEYPVGGKITVENSNVVYKSGCLQDVTSDSGVSYKNFIEAGKTGCSANKVTLPNENARIIEGNYTITYPIANIHNAGMKQLYNDNKRLLWHLEISSTNPHEGKVTSIPWETIYSGEKIIKNAPIEPKVNDKGEKEYIGEFNPGEKTKGITVHAVGGGGAGGGLGNVGKALSPSEMNSAELDELKKELARRFNEVNGTNFSADTIIGVGNYGNISTANHNVFGGGKYILVNTSNGTISGKIDTREDKYRIFPHELLDYTKVLGSSTQPSLVYDMPIWATFKTIENSGFYAGAVACGTKGGDVPSYIIDTFNWAGYGDCKWEKYGWDYTIKDSPSTINCTCYDEDDEPYSCTYVESRNCTCNYKDSTHYEKEYTIDGGSCGTNANSCDSQSYNCDQEGMPFTGASCTHTIVGGKGGAPGKCAVACTKASAPIEVAVICNNGTGKPGTVSTGEVYYGGMVTVTAGGPGRSCYATAGNSHGYSTGGSGGQGCSQSKHFAVDENGNKVDSIPEHWGEGGDMETWLDVSWSPDIGIVADVQSVNVQTENMALPDLICPAVECGSSNSCGANGKSGISSSACDNTDGINLEDHGGLYNHIYTWTIPYKTNKLAYGEAGQSGEYKSAKVSKITGNLQIKLGIGGVWTRPEAGNAGAWEESKQGPNGTDTIVNMINGATSKKIVVAKGGKGGSQSQYTKKYDLCYPTNTTTYGKPAPTSGIKEGIEEGICRSGSNQTNCCYQEKGTRATKDIISTAINLSPFDNIKALAGNSLLIGTGLGRGGEGAGSRAGVEEIGIDRFFSNAAYYDGGKTVLKDSRRAVSGSYDNTAVEPSEMNFKGGDGAVIITW